MQVSKMTIKNKSDFDLNWDSLSVTIKGSPSDGFSCQLINEDTPVATGVNHMDGTGWFLFPI